jgi:hypothetical protein
VRLNVTVVVLCVTVVVVGVVVVGSTHGSGQSQHWKLK